MKKALSLLLTVLMVFTVFAVAVPFASAEDELPEDTVRVTISRLPSGEDDRLIEIFGA